MSSVTYVAALLVFSLVTCLLAFARGGAPERTGAAIILANLVAAQVNESLLHDQIVVLCIDAITALALLPVIMRYASLWLGAVMLLYGLQFALHAYYFVLDRSRDALHVAINNANFFAISLCLGAGTLIAWKTRKARQRTVAP